MRCPLALDEALAFAARYPVGHLDDGTRRRLLTQLTSAPAGTIALEDARGELLLVATVVDVIADATAPAQLEVVGARADVPAAVFADEVLAPAFTFSREAGRRTLQLARPSFVTGVDEVLARAGFARAYDSVLMRRSSARVAAPAPTSSIGWRWAPLDDALVPRAHAALLEISRDAPSITTPPLDEFRRGAFASSPGWHVLLDGDVVVGVVRLSVDGAEGDVRILGRAPAYRGRGVGRVLLDHGLRVLADAGAEAITLEVAANNERALVLYRSFDFAVVERTPILEAVL